ncbi:MAG: CoA transferase [Gammaproteobacteria bacterium]|nr:CoA transferase [Gammaproteobacteria bacterium]
MTQAFDGIRVVDFTQVIAGPFAVQQLGLLGADIIKIEQPSTGDQSRRLMSQAAGFDGTGTSPVFVGVNAGKRSITLDLKHPEAKGVALRLLEGADVLVQNFRAGVMERLGLDYEAVAAVNPTIVYCSISGYGQSGPQKDDAAYDPAVQATSGFMSMTGHTSSGPTRAGPAVIDLSTGLTAAYAIAGALLRRERTGQGQFLDVSMFDTALTMMAPNVAAYLMAGVEPRLNGNLSQAMIPTADVFPTADGYLQVAVLSDAHTKTFCEVIGRADLLDDSRFADYRSRVRHREAMREEIVLALGQRTAAEWLARFEPLRLPITPVLTLPEALDSAQVQHRGTVVELPAPTGVANPVSVVGAGFAASADGPHLTRTAPALGEHTHEVLKEAGYADGDIAGLRERLVV